MKTVLGIAVALVLGWSPMAAAADSTVRASDAWARATGPDTPAGMAFVTLTNTAAEPDRLVSAATPAAARVEFHRHVHAGGTMKMQAESAVELPPGTPVRFAPGGLHVMLDGLKARLVAGQSIPLTLTFARSAPLVVAVTVVAQGAPPPAAAPARPPMPGDHTHDPAHDPAMHERQMQDPAYRAMHEEHMKDPDHRAMHERMHGPGK